MFGFSLISFLFGNYTYKLIFGIKKVYRNNNQKIKIISFDLTTSAILISFLIITNLLLMYQILGDNFFVRDSYHEIIGKSGYLLINSKIVIMVSIILIHIYCQNYFFIRWTSIGFLILISLNYSSMISGAYVLALLICDILYFHKKRIKIIVLYVISAALVFNCSGYFRGMSYQGILNYIKYFSFSEYLETFAFMIFYIFPFPIYVSIATASSYQPNWNDIIIMINPLPGILCGWKDIQNNMVFTANLPYSTMGIVFACGNWFSVLFYFLLGFIFRFYDNTFIYLIYARKLVLGISVLALSSYITLLNGAWDLRSTMRFIYYGTIYAIIIRTISNSKSHKLL